jgi:hypothetical protein
MSSRVRQPERATIDEHEISKKLLSAFRTLGVFDVDDNAKIADADAEPPAIEEDLRRATDG